MATTQRRVKKIGTYWRESISDHLLSQKYENVEDGDIIEIPFGYDVFKISAKSNDGGGIIAFGDETQHYTEKLIIDSVAPSDGVLTITLNNISHTINLLESDTIEDIKFKILAFNYGENWSVGDDPKNSNVVFFTYLLEEDPITTGSVVFDGDLGSGNFGQHSVFQQTKFLKNIFTDYNLPTDENDYVLKTFINDVNLHNVNDINLSHKVKFFRVFLTDVSTVDLVFLMIKVI